MTNKQGFIIKPVILAVALGAVVLGSASFYYGGSSFMPLSRPVSGNSPAITSTSTPSSTIVSPPVTTTITPTSTPVSIVPPLPPLPSDFTLTPSNGPAGTTVTINGNGFTATGNSVTFGSRTGTSMTETDISSADGKTIAFVVPQSIAPYCAPGRACPQYIAVVHAGSYPVSVTSNGVERSAGIFTVTGGGFGAAPQ